MRSVFKFFCNCFIWLWLCKVFLMTTYRGTFFLAKKITKHSVISFQFSLGFNAFKNQKIKIATSVCSLQLTFSLLNHCQFTGKLVCFQLALWNWFYFFTESLATKAISYDYCYLTKYQTATSCSIIWPLWGNIFVLASCIIFWLYFVGWKSWVLLI